MGSSPQGSPDPCHHHHHHRRHTRRAVVHGVRNKTSAFISCKTMREIKMIVIHCSASRCDRDFPFEALDRYHRSLGWKGCGYHYYVTRDGRIHVGRRESEVGAHAGPKYNRHSIGICYEGGLNPQNQPADTRTEAQIRAMHSLVADLRRRYPGAEVLGHRDLPGVHKACPCYDVRAST